MQSTGQFVVVPVVDCASLWVSFCRTSDGEVLSVEFEDGEFTFVSATGHKARSSSTTIEDVSYVCSPYLPAVLRRR